MKKICEFPIRLRVNDRTAYSVTKYSLLCGLYSRRLWHRYSFVCVEYILSTSKLVDNRRPPRNIDDKYLVFGYSPRILDNTRMCGAGFMFSICSYTFSANIDKCVLYLLGPKIWCRG